MQVLWAQGWREWHGADPSQLAKKPRDKSLSHFLGTSRKREFMDPKQQIPSKSSSPLSLPGWFEIFWIYLTLLDGIFSWFFHGMSGSRVWEANVCLCAGAARRGFPGIWTGSWKDPGSASKDSREFWALELGWGHGRAGAEHGVGLAVGFLGITELGKDQGWVRRAQLEAGWDPRNPRGYPSLVPAWNDGERTTEKGEYSLCVPLGFVSHQLGGTDTIPGHLPMEFSPGILSSWEHT